MIFSTEPTCPTVILQISSNRLFNPPLTLLGKNTIEIAFKQLTGVGEVLLGIGDRLGDARKYLIQNSDNALLFGRGGVEFVTSLVFRFIALTVAPLLLSAS